MIRWIVISLSLTIISCSPKLTSTAWQTEIIQSEDFQKIGDRGILVATYQNDSLHIWPTSEHDPKAAIEIGDISQIFTAIQILDLADRGQVNLNTSINQYLPSDYQLPQLKSVTVQDCLSHTGGFPRLPNNIGSVQTDNDQPFEHYTRELFKSFLLKWTPPTIKKYQYSLIGYVLLGIAFKDQLSIKMTNDPVIGHNRIGKEVEPLFAGIFDHAVGYRMSFGQLCKQMDQWIAGNNPQITKSMVPVAPTDIDPSTSVASGWHLYKVDKHRTIALHKGSTSGHSTFIAICPYTKTGLVVAAQKKVELGPLGYNILARINDNWKSKR